jgi:hypothetical protein
MTQTEIKTQFMNRLLEIKRVYGGLTSRQHQIMDELNKLRKQEKESENDIDVVALMDPKANPKEKYKSKKKDLKEELAAVREKASIIHRNGGVQYLGRKDMELNDLATPLLDELLKQTKVDKKRKEDLEKRYDKLILEVVKLENEREEFNRDADKMNSLMSAIHSNTNVRCDNLSEFRQVYDYSNKHAKVGMQGKRCQRINGIK